MATPLLSCQKLGGRNPELWDQVGGGQASRRWHLKERDSRSVGSTLVVMLAKDVRGLQLYICVPHNY